MIGWQVSVIDKEMIWLFRLLVQKRSTLTARASDQIVFAWVSDQIDSAWAPDRIASAWTSDQIEVSQTADRITRQIDVSRVAGHDDKEDQNGVCWKRKVLVRKSCSNCTIHFLWFVEPSTYSSAPSPTALACTGCWSTRRRCTSGWASSWSRQLWPSCCRCTCFAWRTKSSFSVASKEIHFWLFASEFANLPIATHFLTAPGAWMFGRRSSCCFSMKFEFKPARQTETTGCSTLSR